MIRSVWRNVFMTGAFAPIALAVLLLYFALSSWISAAEARKELAGARANTQAALEAQAETIERYAVKAAATDVAAGQLDSASASYRRARDEQKKMSSASAGTPGGVTATMLPAGAEDMVLVSKAYLEAMETALEKADELAVEAQSFKEAAMAERAAADARFAADARVIEAQAVQIRQLELIAKQPGTLERVAKDAAKVLAGYGLAKLLD